MNNNNTVIIGDYLCRLDSGIYFITSNVSNFTSYADFETATFNAAIMKRFGVYVERDSTFSLESSMASTDNIAEAYTMPLDPEAQAIWRFWGKESYCHAVTRFANPYMEGGGYWCGQQCFTRYYRFGILFATYPDDYKTWPC